MSGLIGVNRREFCWGMAASAAVTGVARSAGVTRETAAYGLVEATDRARTLKAAEEYVGALSANPEILNAAVYDSGGALFASYSRASDLPPPRLPCRAVTNMRLNSEASWTPGSRLRAQPTVRRDSVSVQRLKWTEILTCLCRPCCLRFQARNASPSI